MQSVIKKRKVIILPGLGDDQISVGDLNLKG